MRGIIFFVFLSLLSFCEEIQFSQKLKTLNLVLTTNKHYTTISKDNYLQIIVDDQLAPKAQEHSLFAPFEKLEITPLSSKKTQITIFGRNLTLSQSKSQDKIILEIRPEVLKISWLNYFYVCLLLGILIIVLLWLKRRIKHPTTPINYKETPLWAKSKIISFEYEGVEYKIFSNENGNVLLNHYPKEHHNKDFTHLLSED